MAFISQSSIWLAARSTAWTILIPGVVAGYVPWRFFGLGRTRLHWRDGVQDLGLVSVLAGAALLGVCVLEFARSGGGTLSPIDPPRHLVVRGLYRYVRNPMYLAVSTIVLGEALLARSVALGMYWAIWFAAVNAVVIGYEEPNLRQRFGGSYDDYARRVSRWIPHRGTATPRRANGKEQPSASAR